MVQPNHLTVKCESCEELVNPDTPSNRIWFIVGFMAVLGGAGFLAGLTIGIASAGVGVAAWPFLTIIGLYAGYKVGDFTAAFVDSYSCPECGGEFVSPAMTARVMSIVR